MSMPLSCGGTTTTRRYSCHSVKSCFTATPSAPAPAPAARGLCECECECVPAWIQRSPGPGPGHSPTSEARARATLEASKPSKPSKRIEAVKARGQTAMGMGIGSRVACSSSCLTPTLLGGAILSTPSGPASASAAASAMDTDMGMSMGMDIGGIGAHLCGPVPDSLEPLVASIPALTAKVQRLGETSFAALLLIAFLQGFLALRQYRTNPAGELIVPPGLTVGVEDAAAATSRRDGRGRTRGSSQSESGGEGDLPLSLLSALWEEAQSSACSQGDAAKAQSISGGGRNGSRSSSGGAGHRSNEDDARQRHSTGRTQHGSPSPPSITTPRAQSLPRSPVRTARKTATRPQLRVRAPAPLGQEGKDGKESKHKRLLVLPKDSSHMKKGWYYVSKSLVVLLPFLAKRWNYLLLRYGHLLHVGVIVSLTSIFDIREKFLRQRLARRRAKRRDQDDAVSRDSWSGELRGDSSSNSSTSATTATATIGKDPRSVLGKKPRVVVLGDSLACGIGCINIFDENKNSSVPIQRLERLKLDNRRRRQQTQSDTDGDMILDQMGPVFPRVLAKTLSQRLDRPVFWRSAGVDGGTIDDIRTHLLGVLGEEVRKGHAPSLVVVLCGTNDLKQVLSTPFQPPYLTSFQPKLIELVHDIHRIVPKAKVVFPALPMIRIDRNSVFNVFPLSIFLDAFMGFWDLQKKRVAESFSFPTSDATTAVSSNSQVIYLPLTVMDVFSWYRSPDGIHDDRCDDLVLGEGGVSRMPPSLSTLVSADGIHPNARGYAAWAETMGNKLMDLLDVILPGSLPSSSAATNEDRRS